MQEVESLQFYQICSELKAWHPLYAQNIENYWACKDSDTSAKGNATALLIEIIQTNGTNNSVSIAAKLLKYFA